MLGQTFELIGSDFGVEHELLVAVLKSVALEDLLLLR